MSNLHWFKHDRNASFNDKMAELLNHEGSKGYGTYWYIIEMIYMQNQPKAHFNYLKSIERHGFSQSYMKKIITCYGLFVVEEDCFYPIISHSTLDVKTSKNAPEVNPKKTGNEPATEDQPTSEKAPTRQRVTNDKAPTEQRATHDEPTTEDQPTNDKAPTEQRAVNDEPTSEHFSIVESEYNKLIISSDTVYSSLARATRVRTDKNRIEQNRKDKEQIRLTSSSSEKEKRKKNDDDDEFKKRKIQSWQELVEQLPPDSGWGEPICRRCGYSILLKRSPKKAVSQLYNHILAYDRRGQPFDLSEMHRYFSQLDSGRQMPLERTAQVPAGVDVQWQTDHFAPCRFEKIKAGKSVRQGWENRPSSLGKPSVKAGKTVRQSWEDRRSKLERQTF